MNRIVLFTIIGAIAYTTSIILFGKLMTLQTNKITSLVKTQQDSIFYLQHRDEIQEGNTSRSLYIITEMYKYENPGDSACIAGFYNYIKNIGK